MNKLIQNLFTKGRNNTIHLPKQNNFSYKGSWVGVHNNTVMDQWHVGDFSSAVYQITVEFDSNEKEIMQLSVVARPERASYNIYGRSSINDELITFTVTVDESMLKVLVSPSERIYTGAKLIFHATYAETIHPLTAPALVADTSTAEDDGLNTFDATNKTFDNSTVTFDRT
jgi:hypothetical protein